MAPLSNPRNATLVCRDAPIGGTVSVFDQLRTFLSPENGVIRFPSDMDGAYIPVGSGFPGGLPGP